MPSDLQIACTEMTKRLPQVDGLLHQPDEEGQEPGGKPGSSPPWNARVAAVLTDAEEAARRLEASLRLAVTGSAGPRRGGSRGNTEEALRAIPRLGAALDPDGEKLAAGIVERLITAAMQLPAIDEAPVWRSLRPGPDGLPPSCPYCESYQLRVAVRSRVVMCFSPACPGDDSGQRPTATMERMLAGPQVGAPLLVWADGLIQQPPEQPALEVAG